MRKWGLKDGKLVRIEQESQGVVCAGCGELLIPHKGKVRGWYFAHKAGTPECPGSAKAIVRKLLVEYFRGKTEFTIPPSKLVVAGYKYAGATVPLVSVDECPDGILLNSNCLWFQKGTKLGSNLFSQVSSETVSGDSGFSTDGITTLVEVDTAVMESMVDELTLDDVCKFMDAGANAVTFLNPEITRVLQVFSTYKMEITKPYMVCPASLIVDEARPVVMEAKQCRKCAFSSSDNTCLGKGCIADIGVDAFDDKTPLDRYEEYFHKIPEGVGIIKFWSKPFGKCSECGGDYELCRGNAGQKIACVPKIKDIAEEVAVLRCRMCGHIHPLKCPVCGEPMNVRRSRQKQAVYLQCKAHFKGGEGCSEPLSTITVWADENKPEEFADEILAVGDLTHFDKKKVSAALNKLRGK